MLKRYDYNRRINSAVVPKDFGMDGEDYNTKEECGVIVEALVSMKQGFPPPKLEG